MLTGLVLAAWLALVWLRANAAVFSPADQAGPARFYRLSWHGQPVGQQQEQLQQLATGEWLLTLDTRIAATVRDAPLHYREQEKLVFAAEPPYPLLRGDWRREQNAQHTRLHFENRHDGVNAELLQNGQSQALTRPAVAFTLADYFAVAQLVAMDAPVGTRLPFKRFSSERLLLLADELTVVETGSGWRGQPWRLAWKRADERWQAEMLVAPDGTPISMNVGDAIRLERAEPDAVPVSTADLYLGRTIHTDRALGTARDIVVMELRWPQAVSLPLSETPSQTVMPGFVRTDSRQRGPLAPLLEWQAALAPEPRYSPDDHRLQQLAQQLTAGARDSEDKVSRLLHFVSQHLQQQDVLTEQSASEILRARRGDCTEFSRLFVALARAASVPAREVSGLVYLGDEVQGFGGHAWAEVVVDGRWLAVDPMWNLLPVSATHLRMGSGEDGALAAALARRDLQFSVEQISYR